MELYCSECGVELNAVGVDNVSPISGVPLCPDCLEELKTTGELDIMIAEYGENYD